MPLSIALLRSFRAPAIAGAPKPCFGASLKGPVAGPILGRTLRAICGSQPYGVTAPRARPPDTRHEQPLPISAGPIRAQTRTGVEHVPPIPPAAAG